MFIFLQDPPYHNQLVMGHFPEYVWSEWFNEITRQVNRPAKHYFYSQL